MLIPKKLKKNSTIGLIAPSGFITKEKLQNTIKKLHKIGLKTYFTDRILKKHGYLAGTDENRIADIHHHFQNKKVDAILCVRGGYGLTRILHKIDYELIKNNPKALIGYSDITALQYALFKKINLISYHGFLGISEFTEYNINNFKNLLFYNKKEIIHFDEQKQKNNTEYNYYVINHGIATGQLIGGNLSLMTALIGTPYNIDYTNKLVFIEEIDENPYKIDRMLTQLLHATNLKKANGIILGIFNKCSIKSKSENPNNSLSLQQIFKDRLSKIKIPIIYGFSFGHITNSAIFPFGQNAELNTKKTTCKIKIL